MIEWYGTDGLIGIRSRAARIGLSVRKLLIALSASRAELAREHVRAVQGLDLRDALGLLHRPAHQAADSPSDRAVGDRAARDAAWR